MTNSSDEVMTIEELSGYLKISKSTLYKLAQEGGLPGIKVGKHWRFHKDAVVDWLKNHPEHRRVSNKISDERGEEPE